MRKLALIAAVALAAGAAPATAEQASGKGRTVTYEYNLPSSGDGPNFSWTFGGASFDTRKSESSLDLSIEDSSGQTMWVVVYEARKGDDKELGEVCGATERPIDVTPGARIAVRFRSGIPTGCAGDPLGQATTGTMTATFYRR